ncbi:glycosyl hydrolase family 18 protein [Flavitalea flava]
MKKMHLRVLLIPVVLLSVIFFSSYKISQKKLAVIAYVGGFRGLVATDSIDVSKLTHINYAFIDIKDNQAWLHNEGTDTINLRRLVALKSQNPSLKILISIGGWKWSKNFSDAVLTDASRKLFAETAVSLVSRFRLDGIDIDWEYPDLIGDSNVYRPEDKFNYTLMFRSLRIGLDSLRQITHNTYQLTTAVGASENFISHTEMDKAQQYLDYVNIMSYDFREGTDSISGHHTNLFPSSSEEGEKRSSDKAVRQFIQAGVPEQKIVLGIAFYGHGWQMQTADNKGLFRKAIGPYRAGGFTYLKDSVIGRNGFVRYWDKKAKAPYLFQEQDKIFISYDDEQSVLEKCRYTKKNNLGGVMFWEYMSDKKGYLLKVIDDEIGEKVKSYSQFRINSQHSGICPKEGGGKLGNEKWAFKTGGKVFSSPVLQNGLAYIGSEDKNLYAIDIHTGKARWKFITGGAVHSTPAVAAGSVYFGSMDGYYYAVDAATGKLTWKFRTGGENLIGEKGYWGMKPADMYMTDLWDYFLSSPVVETNTEDPAVYFGSSDGNLYAIHAKTGELKWKFSTGGVIHTSPALSESGGTIYIGSWDCFLYAIDTRTGELKWKFKTGDQQPMAGLQSSPTLDGDMVYFGARDASFYALQAGTGALVWKYGAENSWILGTAAIKDGTLYVGTSDSYLLLALDARSGKEKFRFKANGYVFSSPAIAGNTAYFGDFTGNLFALDLDSGVKKGNTFSTQSRQKNSQTLLDKDNLNFMYSAKGADLSYYQNNAKVMQEYYRLGPIVSSPAVFGDVVYFGSADGNVYALNIIE